MVFTSLLPPLRRLCFHLCLFVCLLVNRITQKLLDGLRWNLVVWVRIKNYKMLVWPWIQGVDARFHFFSLNLTLQDWVFFVSENNSWTVGPWWRDPLDWVFKVLLLVRLRFPLWKEKDHNVWPSFISPRLLSLKRCAQDFSVMNQRKKKNVFSSHSNPSCNCTNIRVLAKIFLFDV